MYTKLVCSVSGIGRIRAIKIIVITPATPLGRGAGTIKTNKIVRLSFHNAALNLSLTPITKRLYYAPASVPSPPNPSRLSRPRKQTKALRIIALIFGLSAAIGAEGSYKRI
jgi:hypothetical protein